MSAASWIAYDFAVLRAVPHVHLGAFVAVGVVVHARTAEFLGMRALTDPAALAARVPTWTTSSWPATSARAAPWLPAIPRPDRSRSRPPSERFHWLTAPRSDVLQSSPVHGGLAEDPGRTLEELFAQYVLGHRA